MNMPSYEKNEIHTASRLPTLPTALYLRDLFLTQLHFTFTGMRHKISLTSNDSYEEKLAYISLNIQTPCPPLSAFPCVPLCKSCFV